MHLDLEFPFERSTCHLTRSLRSLVRYKVEHGKINSISTSNYVLFCLLHKHTNDDFFDDFPKISEDSPKVVRRPDERFRTFSKDFRGRTYDVSIIQQNI